MKQLKKFLSFLTVRKRGQKPSSANMPCIIPKEMSTRMSETEIIEIYKPAFRQAGVVIPLAEPKPVQFPLSEEEIQKLKAGLRYVWCDGYEASEWCVRDCKYLGIRITDSFILHETVVFTWEDAYHRWVKKCRARLLRREEIMLLNLVWDEVSAMRVKAWDVPLPKRHRFWIQKDYSENKYGKDHATCFGQLLSRDTETHASLLMAVTND